MKQQLIVALLGVAAMAAAGVLAWHLRAAQAPHPAEDELAFVRSAAMAHRIYAPEVRHPVEVTGKDEAHLAAWLSARLGAPVRAPALESAGYNLVGGRLLPGGAAAPGRPQLHGYFMYQNTSGSRLSLAVRVHEKAVAAPAPRITREGPVNVIHWLDRQLEYVLASVDVSAEALLPIAEAARRELSPCSYY